MCVYVCVRERERESESEREREVDVREKSDRKNKTEGTLSLLQRVTGEGRLGYNCFPVNESLKLQETSHNP